MGSYGCWRKRPTFVKRYFTDPTPVRDIDRLEWHAKVQQIQEQGKADRNRGYSLRIGQMITFPIRVLLSFTIRR